jgi:hypothetical protein
VIVGAALTPGPPLLAPELSRSEPEAARLRAACREAVAELADAAPEVVVVVGPADRSATWPPDHRVDLARFGGRRPPGPAGDLPLSLGMGALLLDAVEFRGPRRLCSVAADAALPECLALAAEVRDAPGRTALVIVADGSARRSVKAPGYLDERAEPYDSAVGRAVAEGHLAALATLDPSLARELMAGGWPALQVLAGAFTGSSTSATVWYDAAPFGVGYLVATVWPTA